MKAISVENNVCSVETVTVMYLLASLLPSGDHDPSAMFEKMQSYWTEEMYFITKLIQLSGIAHLGTCDGLCGL